MFQVVRVDPVRCQSTDGLIGQKVTWRSCAYETRKWAHIVAARMGDKDYRSGGDSNFVVVEAGGSPFKRPIYPPRNWGEELDDIVPF